MKIAVDKKDSSGLARMYNLFSRVAGLKMLCDAFKVHVNVRPVSYLLPIFVLKIAYTEQGSRNC